MFGGRVSVGEIKLFNSPSSSSSLLPFPSSSSLFSPSTLRPPPSLPLPPLRPSPSPSPLSSPLPVDPDSGVARGSAGLSRFSAARLYSNQVLFVRHRKGAVLDGGRQAAERRLRSLLLPTGNGTTFIDLRRAEEGGRGSGKGVAKWEGDFFS